MINYTEGEVYYRITYAEPKMLYPNIETLVYIGKNLSEDDLEDTWYFQFSRSYAKYGSVTETDEGDRAVSCLTKSDLGDMLDTNDLLDELEASVVRRKQE